MKFSLLMAVYYREKVNNLDEALKSILNQTIPPDEIVIVKDGTLTKELEELLRLYKKRYRALFKIIGYKENKGLGKALELGVLHCSYEWIARMDSDDISCKDRFEKQINFLKEHRDIKVVGSYISEFYKETSNLISTRRVPLNSADIASFARFRNPFNHMTVMFNKSVVLECGNYKELLYFEDYYLWMRMIRNNINMANIDEVLVFVRVDENMYKRRGGINYIKYEYILQKKFLESEFINIYEFIINITIRGAVRMIPNNIRGLFYKMFLRNYASKRLSLGLRS